MSWNTLLLFLVLIPGFPTEEMTTRVIRVKDGDTFTIQDTDNKTKIVRLFASDAPELPQPYGTRAKNHLKEMIQGKDVRIRCVKVDAAGKIIADVWVGDVWVNLQMIEDGFAWYNRRLTQSPEMDQAMRQARAARKGLWFDPKPEEPWVYRLVVHWD